MTATPRIDFSAFDATDLACCAEADEDKAIGGRYEILPAVDAFSGFSPRPRRDLRDVAFEKGWVIAIDEAGTCARAYSRLTGACIGEYDGPSLYVLPAFRGQRIGAWLCAVRFLAEAGMNPQSEMDEIGYTPGGLAASLRGLELARAAARAAIAAPVPAP